MAAEPYRPFATVEPEVQQPQDTLRVEATPAEFGGLVAQGATQFGQGAYRAGMFLGQVAADQANNNFQSQAADLVTHYGSLRGQAAMEARPGVQKQLDDLLSQTRETLTTPAQQLQFDQDSRRFRTYLLDKVGAHYDQQAQVWQTSVHKQTILTNQNLIAADPTNAQHVADAGKNMIDGYVNLANVQGTDPQLAVTEGRRAALTTQIQAIGATDPGAALRMVSNPANQAVLGPAWPKLYETYKNPANAQIGKSAALSALHMTQVSPVLEQAAAKYNIDPELLLKEYNIESGGRPNAVSSTGARGPFQFIGSTARQYGITNPNDLSQSADGAAHYAADNRAVLEKAFGRQPTNAELYLAHQQGSKGAAKLILNPNVRAGDLVGDEAIRVNGGDPNAPAHAFTSMWARRYAAAPTSSGLTTASIVNTPGAFTAAGQPPDFQQALKNLYSNTALTPDQQLEGARMINAFRAAFNGQTAIERQQLRRDTPDLIAAAEDGNTDIPFPEARIRAAFPPAQAQYMIDQYNVAKHVGTVLGGLRYASPQDVNAAVQDITSGQGVLSEMMRVHSRGAATGPGATPEETTQAQDANFYRMRTSAVAKLRKVLAERDSALFGADADPVAYVANEPSVVAATQAAKADPTQIPAMVNAILGVQDHLGVPPDQQHILSRGQALDIASKMTQPGADVVGALKQLQQTYGASYPHVFRDLATLGKLPSTYQAVAKLSDPMDAQLLARALQEAPGAEASKDQTKSWASRLEIATGDSKAAAKIKTQVLSSPTMREYVNSLSMQGLSNKMIDDIVNDVSTLAYAKVYWNHDSAATAGEDAVQSFAGSFNYDMPGGPRVPMAVAPLVHSDAAALINGVSAKTVKIPPGFGGHGQPTVDDYIRQLKSGHIWKNTSDGTGVRLLDYAGRPVLRPDGVPVTLSFAHAGDGPSLKAPNEMPLYSPGG